MASTLNSHYQSTRLGQFEYFLPTRVIGADTQGTRRLVRNGSWVWSYCCRRALFQWADTDGRVITPGTLTTQWYALGRMSLSRERITLWADGDDVRVRLQVYDASDLTTLLSNATLTLNSGAREQQSTTLTGITTQDVYLVIAARYDTTQGTLYGVGASEANILQASL